MLNTSFTFLRLMVTRWTREMLLSQDIWLKDSWRLLFFTKKDLLITNVYLLNTLWTLLLKELNMPFSILDLLLTWANISWQCKDMLPWNWWWLKLWNKLLLTEANISLTKWKLLNSEDKITSHKFLDNITWDPLNSWEDLDSTFNPEWNTWKCTKDTW
jgi:hypothetical protein